MVTVIVQLKEDERSSGFSLFGFNVSGDYGRENVKKQITNLINGREADDAGSARHFHRRRDDRTYFRLAG